MSTNVLCYSGGLDSYAMSKLFSYDKFVFFKLGNVDNEKELEVLQKYGSKDILDKLVIVDLPLSQFELPNKILPYRNHIMAMIASNYGAHVHFGFTKGDTTKDKDYIFKSQMEGILNYFAIDKHKVNHPEYPYIIKMPFRNWTKSQIVAALLEKVPLEQILLESRSCYAGGEHECGNCKSCFRKYQAFKVNGVDIPVNMEGYLEYIKNSHREGETEEGLTL